MSKPSYQELKIRIKELETALAATGKAEDSLTESENHFRNIAESMPFGILTLDFKGTVIYCSKSFLKITGFKKGDIVSRHFTRLPTIRKQDIKEYVILFSQIIKNRFKDPLEFTWLHKNGAERLGEARFSLLKDKKKIIGVQALLEDITHRKETEEELKKTADKLEFALEAASDGVWDLNAVTNEAYFSPRWFTMLGYDYGEIPNTFKGWASLLFKEDLAKALKTAELYLNGEGKEPYVSEFRMKMKDGGYKWVYSRGKTVEWSKDGKPARVIGTHIDITELKHAEAALQESEGKYKRLIETSPDITYIFNSSTGGIYWSDRVKDILGFTLDDLRDNPKIWYGSIHPEDLPAVDKAIGQPGTGKGFDIEYRIRDKNGQWHWFHDRSIRMRNENGDVIIEGLATDITKRKHDEMILSETKEWYKSIFEGSRDAIFISDEDSRFIAVNEAAIKLTGYSRKKLLTMRIPDLHEEMDLNAYDQYHGRIMSGEEIVSEAKILRKDKQKVDTEFNNRRITIAGKNYMHTTARDISDKVKAENELKEARERFQKAAEIATDVIYEWNVETNELIWFGDIDKVLGYDKGEFVHSYDAWRAAIHPEEKERMHNIMEFHRNSKKPIDVEYRIQKKNGEYLHWSEQGTPIEDENGEFKKVIGICRDITARKNAEKVLKESEERFRQVAENINEVFWVVSSDWSRIHYISPAYEKTWGHTCESLYQEPRSWIDCIVEEDRAKVLEYIERKTQGDFIEIDFPEYRIKRPDGTVRWILARGFPVKNEKGEIYRIAGIAEDMTDRKQSEEEIISQKKRAESYFHIAEVMLLVIDADQTVSRINKKGCEIVGYTEQEIVGKNWFDNFLSDESREDIRNIFIDLMNGNVKQHEDVENYVVTREGEMRYISWHNTLIKNDDGVIIGTLSSGEDITERKKAVDELKESLQHSRQKEAEINGLLKATYAILESAKFEETARTIFDLCKDLIGAKSGYVALLNTEGDENELLFLEAGGFPCTVDQDLPMPIRGLREEAYKTGKTVCDNDFMNSGWTAYLPGGHVELKNVLFAPLNIGKKTVGIMGLANKAGDFTENDKAIASAFGELAAVSLKNSQAIEMLEDNEMRFRELFHNLGMGVAVYEAVDDGADFVFKEINEAGATINRRAREDTIGGKITELFPGVKEMGLFTVLQHVCKTGQPEHHPLTVYEDNRINIWVDNYVFKLPSGDIVAVYNDLTSQKQMEEERKVMQDQLFHAQKMESIGRLAGGVAHDFNNILVGIMGYAELLKIQFDDAASPEGEAAEVILENAERAANLTKQLLGFARKGKFNPVPLNVNTVIKETVKVSEKIFEKSIDVKFEFDRKISTVEVDRHQFEQVLTNLLINSKDAMPNGGSLALKTEDVYLGDDFRCTCGKVHPGTHVMIEIADSGVGIPEENMSNIFEPFFTTKSEGKGTGLGLATVYGIITNHHGHVTVESEPGLGTIFRLYLPVSAKKEAVVVKKEKIIAGKGTVLVVDDEKNVRNLARDMLKGIGYDVLLARSGKEAIRIFKKDKDRIDVVVLDIIMPGLSGKETYEALKEIDPGVKVLLSSGYSRDDQAAEIMKDGTIGFIQKPYKMEGLSKAVADALILQP
ncbi:PAS domain S-box protein [candidate division KSB1 bacterium]